MSGKGCLSGINLLCKLLLNAATCMLKTHYIRKYVLAFTKYD